MVRYKLKRKFHLRIGGKFGEIHIRRMLWK